MEEEKTSLVNEVAAAGYDAAEKPFDFIGTDSKTALVCESTPVIKEKITTTLINMGYHVTEPASGREALKSMRFHVYDLIIAIDEEKRAAIDLASILMMYSCGKYGMEPIY